MENHCPGAGQGQNQVSEGFRLTLCHKASVFQSQEGQLQEARAVWPSRLRLQHGELCVPQSRGLVRTGDSHQPRSFLCKLLFALSSVALRIWDSLPASSLLRAWPPGIPAKPFPLGNGFLMARDQHIINK